MRAIWVWICVGCLVLAGCGGTGHDRTAVAAPKDRYEAFYPVGVNAYVRAYDDATDKEFEALQAYYKDQSLTWIGARGRGLRILALSGGGQDGAFGAGVLQGWTESGTRPQFDMVTGISSGALIAPFAFLGPAYDARLKAFFTETTTRDIVDIRLAAALFGSGYLASTSPLAKAINDQMDVGVMRAIARESQKGRSLIVGTTNIDAERPVMWDIGAMARIGTPEAYAVIRKVILASASIPIAFEPVRIAVTDGRELREELHVDGGLTREIFVYPEALDMRRILRDMGIPRKASTIWLLHNKRLARRYEAQDTRLLKMGERTFQMLIRSQSKGNIDYILSLAARDGLRAHVMSIPASFEEEPREAFDPVYMRDLFALGVSLGRRKDGWLRDQQKRFD